VGIQARLLDLRSVVLKTSLYSTHGYQQLGLLVPSRAHSPSCPSSITHYSDTRSRLTVTRNFFVTASLGSEGFSRLHYNLPKRRLD